MFVSLPFVVREAVPALREVGNEQEEAASTLGASSWQAFWRVTLPSLAGGDEIWAQLTREEAERLELHEGQRIHVRPQRTKAFSGAPAL